MKLTDDDIKEFQAIYKEEYGKEISNQEAYDSANKLIGLVKILLEPD